MLNVRHFQPTTFPTVDGRDTWQTLDLLPPIVDQAYDHRVLIPSTDLDIHLFRFRLSTRVEFRRSGERISTHIFCIAGLNVDALFEAVADTLRQRGHNPKKDLLPPYWIYSIPTSRIPFTPDDSKIIHGIVFGNYALLLIQRIREMMEN